MKWPLVSRRAYDVVLDENARLRAQVDGLIDHTCRIDRIEHGVGEVPRPPRPVYEPMPQEIRHYVDGWAAPSIRKATRDKLVARYKNGESWDSIKNSILEEQREDDDTTA